jgi:hypothetical protein
MAINILSVEIIPGSLGSGQLIKFINTPDVLSERCPAEVFP